MTRILSCSSCCLWSSLPSLDYTYLSVKSFGGWNGFLLVRHFSGLDLLLQLMCLQGGDEKGYYGLSCEVPGRTLNGKRLP